ncbi:MAG: hypothetical protein VB131_01535 [Burkholderia gladioli]
MTIPTTGLLGIDRIKVELAMDGLNPPANDLNNYWLRRLANKPSGPISFADFRGRGCRFDGHLNVSDPYETGGGDIQADFSFPFFNTSCLHLRIAHQLAVNRWGAAVYLQSNIDFNVKIWVWNSTTNLAYTFVRNPQEMGTYRAENVNPSFMRLGNGDWFVIAPDLR